MIFKTPPLSKVEGAAAEELACRYLSARGLQLVSRNFSCRFGEIDLIMRDRGDLVFVEVRYRRNASFGSAAASIDWRKQDKLVHTANYYLQTKCPKGVPPCRFDVVAVSDNIGTPAIEWLRNAIEL